LTVTVSSLDDDSFDGCTALGLATSRKRSPRASIVERAERSQIGDLPLVRFPSTVMLNLHTKSRDGPVRSSLPQAGPVNYPTPHIV